jgi:DnaJ-class molecular chaperone
MRLFLGLILGGTALVALNTGATMGAVLFLGIASALFLAWSGIFTSTRSFDPSRCSSCGGSGMGYQTTCFACQGTGRS